MNSKLCFLLAALLLALFSLTTCESQTADEYTYALNYIDYLSEDSFTFSGFLNGSAVFGRPDKETSKKTAPLLHEIREKIDPDFIAPTGTVLFTYDVGSKRFVKKPLTSYFGESHYLSVSRIAEAPDGGLLVIGCDTSLDDLTESVDAVMRFDRDGKCVFFKSIEDIDFTGINGISKIFVDNAGNVYIYYKNPFHHENGERFDDEPTMLVFSPEMELRSAFPLDISGYSGAVICQDKDGVPFLVFQNGEHGEYDYVSCGLDLKTGALLSMNALKLGSGKPCFDKCGNLFCFNNFGLFSITVDENIGARKNMLFDWAVIGVDATQLRTVTVYSDSLMFISLSSENNQTEFYLIAKEKTSDVRRTDIRIAIDSSDESVYTRAIVKSISRFNRTNDEFRALPVYYSGTEGGFSASQKLARDLASDNEPDVIIFNGGISYELLSEKMNFANLYEFMDGDNEYNRETLLPCLYKPFEKDGRLEYLATQYYADFFVINTGLTGDLDRWSFDDLLRINNSLADDEYLMAYRYDDRTKAANNILNYLLPYFLGEMIDYDQKTCDLSKLPELIEFCKTTKLYKISNTDYDLSKVKYALQIQRWCDMPLFIDYLSEAPANAKYIGCPGLNSKLNGGVVVSRTGVGIIQNSKNQKGAWQFIGEVFRSLDSIWALSEHLPKKLPFMSMPPTCKALSELRLTLDRYGYDLAVDYPTSFRIPTKEENLGEPVTLSPTIAKLRGEDIELMTEQLTKTVRASVSDPESIAIILEEASYYFSGVKPLDEVVKIIADRIETKISE